MTADDKHPARLVTPQQSIVFQALLTAIKRGPEAWASTEEVANAGGLTLRQTRRKLRARGKVGMVYPATKGRYWAPEDDITRLRLQSRAWDRYDR